MTLYELLKTADPRTIVDIGFTNGEDNVVSNVPIISAEIPFYLLTIEVDRLYSALVSEDDPDGWRKSKIVIRVSSV